MRIMECASCFRNQTNGDFERIKFVHKLFPMEVTKRSNECKQCAKRRHIKIFNRHNALNCLAAISTGGLNINWTLYVNILRKSEAARKYGATKVLLALSILSIQKTGAYGIYANNVLVGPVVNRFAMLYFTRKSDAAEFASIALMGLDGYRIVDLAKGAAA